MEIDAVAYAGGRGEFAIFYIIALYISRYHEEKAMTHIGPPNRTGS